MTTIRQKFKNSIKRGTGDAYLILKENPTVNFSNDIIKAALINYSYDNQSEGSRANYIFELIQISNQKEKIKQAILKALSKGKNEAWTLVQLFDLAALFAKQGDKKAKKIIYKRYFKEIIEGFDWIGESAIIDLDGIEGLKYIAETRGKLLKKDPEYFENSLMVDFFQEENPSIKVYEELQKSGERNKYVQIYFNTILKNKFEMDANNRQKYNYELISEKIKANLFFRLPPSMTKELSKEDIIKLANDFLNEKLRIKQEKYLRLFDSIKFPYNYQILLNMAKRPYSSKDRLVEFAIKALRFFSGIDIRKFALYKIQNSKKPDIYTNLLISNYKTGDSKILNELLEKAKNIHKIHSLASSFVDIYETNKTTECKEPLIMLYNRLTCGIHRNDIVKILIENNVLPDNIKEEIRYDSYEKTRKLYKK